MQLSVQVNTYLCILKATEKEKKKEKKKKTTTTTFLLLLPSFMENVVSFYVVAGHTVSCRFNPELSFGRGQLSLMDTPSSGGPKCPRATDKPHI